MSGGGGTGDGSGRGRGCEGARALAKEMAGTAPVTVAVAVVLGLCILDPPLPPERPFGVHKTPTSGHGHQNAATKAFINGTKV